MNKKLNTKRAFTFAELMISLVIIGVITLIMYPTISDLAPNNNKYLLKETYQTITMIVSDYINSADKTAMPTSAPELCQIFCNSLNVNTIENNNEKVGTCDGTITKPGCTDFTTSNGMRWAFAVIDPDPGVAGDEIGYVLVDVNASNNNTTNTDSLNFPAINAPAGANIFNANANPWTNNGSGNGVFYTGDTTTQDTFLFSISNKGRVSPVDGVAVTHLQSDDQDK